MSQLARVKETYASPKRGGKTILTPDQVFKVKSIDQEKGTIDLIDNINPETIHTLAITAVELFDEGNGLWKSIKDIGNKVVAFGKKVGEFFKSIGERIKKK